MGLDDEQKVDHKDGPPSETTLEVKEQRDPDEAVIAEQAIHHYASDVLDRFRDNLQNALGAFTAWVESEHSAETFDNAGFNAQIGEAFLQQMVSACGGMDTPIGAAMFEKLDSLVDEAVMQEEETSFFVEMLSSGARDFTWYLRDNLQSVLTNEWDQLRDLAYEGSTDFIQALHAFGMPKPDWSPTDMTSTMIALAEEARDGAAKTPEEAVAKDAKQEEEEQAQLLLEEEEKKAV
ncbi:MAG TPA: hypothetical protein VGL86_33435 [Polyangia bacterium]|jgi:hypothetical protein